MTDINSKSKVDNLEINKFMYSSGDHGGQSYEQSR